MRVLIVEDEKRLAQALGQIMEEQRYQVDIVYDGQDGLDYALSGQYDIVVLDVMLPKKDGFEVVRQLREVNQSVPVLMLTARDDVTDKVLGLDCGAKSVSLGFKEFEVLKLLLANPNGIVSKEELLVKVWGSDSNAEDNNVEAYISFLRKKFFYLGSHAGIGTVRKVGYHLEEQI